MHKGMEVRNQRVYLVRGSYEREIQNAVGGNV